MSLKLYKRGAVYYIRGTVAGQRVYESTRIGDKRAADLYRARREAEILERVTLGVAANLTFAEAALTYLETGGESRFLALILEHFGPRFRLIDLDNDSVNRAAKAIYPDAAPSTINRQLITPISAVYKLASDEGKVPSRAFRRRPSPPGRKRWLTPEEAERLLEACDARLKPMVAFLLGTGVRTNEMFRLRRDQLHLDTGEAWIEISKNGAPKMVTFPDKTRRILVTHDMPEAGAVFRTPKGRPYKLRKNGGGQIEAAFATARKAAGLGEDVTPHVLRHTWATWHWAQNKDLLALMHRGGWKRPEIAMEYTKLGPANLGERIRAVGWDFLDARPPDVGQTITKENAKGLPSID